MARTKRPPEAVSGSYTPVPHALLDSNAFTGASLRAKAMLFEFIRQHNGRNNGHLQATAPWLKSRGWKSKEAIRMAVSELIERDLVVVTKHGGLNNGPSQYALTWLQIASFAGLELGPQSYWPGAWNACVLPPASSNRRVKKREERPDSRGSAAPIVGVVKPLTAPIAGAKTTFHGCSTAPIAGDNECCQLPPDDDSVHSGVVEGSAPEVGRMQAYLAKLAEARLGTGSHAARVGAHLRLIRGSATVGMSAGEDRRAAA